jgi:hypothetical protein
MGAEKGWRPGEPDAEISHVTTGSHRVTLDLLLHEKTKKKPAKYLNEWMKNGGNRSKSYNPSFT